MNATSKANVSTIPSSVFMRGELKLLQYYMVTNQRLFLLMKCKYGSGKRPPKVQSPERRRSLCAKIPKKVANVAWVGGNNFGIRKIPLNYSWFGSPLMRRIDRIVKIMAFKLDLSERVRTQFFWCHWASGGVSNISQCARDLDNPSSTLYQGATVYNS